MQLQILFLGWVVAASAVPLAMSNPRGPPTLVGVAQRDEATVSSIDIAKRAKTIAETVDIAKRENWNSTSIDIA